ncbi:hypothetical protein DTO96_100527 [Ephemeroptericola cinctiostellae]|uniref:DUF4390 domain-containing protein n=1 Tax=Ephemeroptericola cinctiostellae TaxID=2268024 RepID=A0A345D8X9_9BURK|nr:DUF4390 domain-containing protein [Ephemeroptericola cinctiostellae]AXF84817.1 hypothetical protein DTO96_100527 [Ephemeroptericola cinctiostellae]
MLIVHSYPKSTFAQHWQRICAALILVCAALILPSTAQAAITPQYATLSRMSDGGYSVNADFRFAMPQQLQDAINHGTPITFTVDFELSRPRWYWANEDVVSARRDYRISYNSLTQQYRVAADSDQYRFNTLSECILFASRPNQWRVLGSDQYTSGEQYDAAIRLSLNTSKLPRTYQLNSLTQQGWGLNSGWYRFNFTPR